ncbi:hypothetical protein [Chryseobacterium daeguense]|uniref:hypothetical protein n=1 Tax=Chryseobacterium daeguense TaxID=412438 RepID=UPI000412DC6C|nr:hypothetical protein [Chryseobacterium daeguense]
MNHRVLELLKAPKNIQSEDLDLLKEEINSFPYVQNIRALYLYGVHVHDKENYQKVLSTTAAYTTDKKILYQLINGKIQHRTKPEITKEKPAQAENPLKILYQTKAGSFPIKREEISVVETEPEAIENIKEEETDKKEQFSILPTPPQEIKHLYVNGERNRILFEGEENFLEDENVDRIDLESTLESVSIVTQKTEKPTDNIQGNIHNEEIPVKETPEIVEEFTPETIIEEENITSEAEKEIVNESELSFHETQSFLPDVQVNTNKTEDTEKPAEEVKEFAKTIESADFTPEKIINEDKISSEKETKSVRDDEELSFHGMPSFLPEVKIQANADEKAPEISKPTINKHEEEMRRLIEEVEKKMKEKAASQEIKKEEEPENIGHDISFAETQSFEVKPSEPVTKKEDKPEPAALTDIVEDKSDQKIEETQVNSSWKPMFFESNLPDSLINKSVEIPSAPKPEVSQTEAKNEDVIKPEEILPEIEEIPELVLDESEKFEGHTQELQIDEEAPEAPQEKKEEAPVMNVSFFGSGWTLSQSERQENNRDTKEENKEIKQEKTETNAAQNPDSNVPGFINTWQSWLKIDRTEERGKDKTEVKKKVIEAFIENNPKISQLKEEVNFVVKEKNDDISHLMTETLANLYIEQKLYTKAIKAFEALIKKTPEKKEYYEGKIQEIKDFRSKN